VSIVVGFYADCFRANVCYTIRGAEGYIINCHFTFFHSHGCSEVFDAVYVLNVELNLLRFRLISNLPLFMSQLVLLAVQTLHVLLNCFMLSTRACSIHRAAYTINLSGRGCHLGLHLNTTTTICLPSHIRCTRYVNIFLH